LVHVDTLKTPATDELSSRLQVIGDGIEQLIIAHKPSAIALERVFAQANLRSVMGVAQISGVVLFLAAKYGIPIEMHTPSEVKAAVTGSGRAAKPQIGIAVSKILGLTEIPKPADSADALAIAICNAWKSVGPVSAASKPTKAQAQWLSAQSASKRKGKA
jgi:crossover junction endodeoxyribonuclease RuvC